MERKHPASQMGCSPEAVRMFDQIVGDENVEFDEAVLNELAHHGLVDIIDGEPVIPLLVYRQWETFMGK